jgi:hypothetical protein
MLVIDHVFVFGIIEGWFGGHPKGTVLLVPVRHKFPQRSAPVAQVRVLAAAFDKRHVAQQGQGFDGLGRHNVTRVDGHDKKVQQHFHLADENGKNKRIHFAKNIFYLTH